MILKGDIVRYRVQEFMPGSIYDRLLVYCKVLTVNMIL